MQQNSDPLYPVSLALQHSENLLSSLQRKKYYKFINEYQTNFLRRLDSDRSWPFFGLFKSLLKEELCMKIQQNVQIFKLNYMIFFHT